MRQFYRISQIQARITSGKIILDESTRNKIFLEFLGDYNRVCLKKFQRIEPNLENAFLAKFSIPLRIS